MAVITGSTAIDWSTISLDLVDYQAQYDALNDRLESVLTDLETGQFRWNSRPTSTFGSVTLTSMENAGAIVNMGGSGFGSPSALVTSVSYRNPSTSDFFKVRGSFNGAGNEVLTGFTFGTSGLEARFSGRIVADASGNFLSGTVNMLQLTVDTTTISSSGSLIVDANFDFVGGAVTGIAVVSDSNTILMTGLSLPYSVLDPATTAEDLFTLIGSQLSGNDTILYTNNSGNGMSVSGGAGNDIITISGPNGDTLDGDTGNDILNGGAGDDTLLGGDGNDVFVIGNASDHGAGEIITGGAGDDVIRFTSTTPGQSLVLAPGVTEVEQVTISTAAGVSTGRTALNVDASAVGSGLSITGNAGANVLTGTAFNDVLMGNAGNDELIGGDGDDTYVIGQGLDVLTENSGEGTDTVLSSITHTLGDNFENLTLTGTRAINGVGNELANVLTGNNAANILAGGDGNDTLIGNAGNDRLDGGEGDDTMDGGAGNDTLIGGLGQDSAQYGGLLNEYVLGTTGGMLTITDRNRLTGNEGTDQVTEVEQLHFADATLTVTRGEVKIGGTQYPSAVAGLANGGYVVTWTGSDGPFSLAISAQRYTAQGERVGSPTRVNTTTIGPQEDSAVAGLATGGYVVTWRSTTQTFSDSIYAQRYNAQGVRVGSETRVNTTTTGSQSDSAVAGLANGGYVVTWTSTDQTFADSIYAQRYNAQGARVGGETLVNTTTDGSQGDSAVAGLATGGYVVIWRSTTQTFSESIYAQRYNSQGVPVGSETLASTTTGGSGTNGAVAGLVDGGYVVTWTSADASSSGIYAQRYDAQGVPVGSATSVNTTTNGSQSDSAVAGLADGGYIVTWKSSDTIYAQRYDAQGVPVGGETLVNSTTAGSQNDGAVAGLANGGYAVTWTATDAFFSSDIYTQPYDAQGEAVGGYIVTGTAGADQLTVGTQTLLTVDGAGGDDILTGGASSDRLLGGDGNDILSGGAGADIQQGGAGDDLFLLGSVTDFAAGEILDGGADTDTLRYTGSAGTLILTNLVRGIEEVQIASAGGSILGTGTVNINATNAFDPLTLTGNNGANVLTGTFFDDTLVGNGGNDTLSGNWGNDTLNGGVGNDSFLFNTDGGQDIIQDNSGIADIVRFGATIDSQDLVISRQVDDLRLAVAGSTDSVTIQNWYTSSANQIETIRAGDGQVLLSSQVDQLIQAMATFTQQTGLSWDAAAGGAGTAQDQAGYQAIIAAAWQ
jgi:Ca2+-binding RTX toxin-like protein